MSSLKRLFQTFYQYKMMKPFANGGILLSNFKTMRKK